MSGKDVAEQSRRERPGSMDWRGRRVVAAVVVMLYVYHVRSQCIEVGRTVSNCPNPLQTAIVSSSSDGLNIGGLFSDSGLTYDVFDAVTPICTRCQGASNNSLQHRFAVEQAEALLYAIDVIERELRYPVGHRIMDTCGLSDCLADQVREYHEDPKLLQSVLATVVGPYYQKDRDSMSEYDSILALTDILAISPTLSAQFSTGILSLLDLPFSNSDTDISDLFVMIQQTCELQASVAVDFLAQEGWGNVAIVASSDSCGGKSLLEVHNHIQRKEMGCHFNVCSVHV